MMLDEHTIKVYTDAVQCGLREIETIPDEYRKAVEGELYERKKKRLK